MPVRVPRGLLGALLLLAVVGTSCAASPRLARTRQLTETSFVLQQAYRWKDGETLRRLFAPELHPALTTCLVEPGADLVITDTEGGRLEVHDEDATSATLNLVLRWYRLPSVTEQTSPLRCKLRHRGGIWVVVEQQDEGGSGVFTLE
ncbi:MAG: hypothetical protein RBU45_01710 [Myxococcota bacterium]|nr:hypothetical protein [Myxococcota bacterium]